MNVMLKTNLRKLPSVRIPLRPGISSILLKPPTCVVERITEKKKKKKKKKLRETIEILIQTSINYEAYEYISWVSNTYSPVIMRLRDD